MAVAILETGGALTLQVESTHTEYGIFICFHMELYSDYHQVHHSWNIRSADVRILGLSVCYASAFRRRRHYVFRLSVRPSVGPSEAWNALFPPVHWSVGPSDQPWPFCCMSVRPSVGSFRAFAGERMEGMAWNFACWCILPSVLIRLWSRSVDFYPRPVLAFGYCRCLRLCVSLCVNHLLVRAITRDPFKLGSPNLKHSCKRPWLRSLLFWGGIDLYLQGQIYLQSQNLPHFELVRAITRHPFKLGPPNLDQRCKIPWLGYLLFWGFIELDMSN